MPGFDGTGPLKGGPLSGHGNGFCVLQFPAKPGGQVTGYAGKEGWPILIPTHRFGDELVALYNETRKLEAVLLHFKQRITHITHNKTLQPTGDSICSTNQKMASR